MAESPKSNLPYDTLISANAVEAFPGHPMSIPVHAPPSTLRPLLSSLLDLICSFGLA